MTASNEGTGRPVADMSFTEASAELDGIVERFEQGQVDVDELVANLERATAIVDELDRRIRATRAQVEELVPRLAAVAGGQAPRRTDGDAEGAADVDGGDPGADDAGEAADEEA